jgi:eukaryotic-like serine/threonine-protein kinase
VSPALPISAVDEMPAQVGRYHPFERLGGGTTSIVYAATEDGSPRAVALKMIVADLADEREARERFLREARVTANLRHPNIVSVLDVGEDDGRPFIVMERLRGVSLPAYLQSASISLDQRLDLMRQLCDGLQAAHESGVIHRDIKPSNLFIEPDRRLKILDFGLARLQASTLTASGQIVGTPHFMSPEQAMGRQVDARSDIFSAGAVGYLIITGRLPFSAPDLRQTLHALLNDAPAPITEAEAPAAVAAILAKALAKAPGDRYPSCAAMRTDLQYPRGTLQPAAVWKRIASYVGVLRS